MTTGDSNNGSDNRHRLSDQISANTPFKVATFASFGTVTSTRGLMSYPVVDAIMSRDPSPSSFIVAPVPDG